MIHEGIINVLPDCSYQLGNLKKLDVYITLFDEERGIDTKCNLLKDNTTIETLKVQAVFDTNLSAKFIGVLRSMTRLRSLALHITDITDYPAELLANEICACKGIEELIIKDATCWTETGPVRDIKNLLKGLDKCPNLSKISLEVHSDDAMLALGGLIRSLKPLKEVHLVLKGPFSGEALMSVFNTTIQLSVGIESIVGASDEHYVSILNALQSTTKLRELRLLEVTLDQEMQKAVSDVLTKCHFLRNLELSSPSLQIVQDSLIDALQKRTLPLEQFSCSCLAMDTNFNRAIESLRNATFYRCHFKEQESFCAAVADNRTIETLALIDLKLSEKQCTAIQHLLRTNSTLKELNLKNQHVAAKGAVDICRGLQANNSLLRFHMPGNMLGFVAFEACNEMLQVNDTLEELSINYVFSDRELKEICNGLKLNKSLTSLHFYKKPDLDYGSVFAELLEENHVLRSVTYGEIKLKLSSEQMDKYLERNRAICEATKKDMIVLFCNIRRSTEALQLFPVEIWLQIFKPLRLLGCGYYETAQFTLLQ